MAGQPAYNRALQVERTAFAWNRSALALASNGGLLIREGAVRHAFLVEFTGFLVIVIAAGAWSLPTARYPRALASRAAHLVLQGRQVVFAMTVVVFFLSAMNLVLVVVP